MAATVLALLLVLQPGQVTTTTILSSAGAPAPEESQESSAMEQAPLPDAMSVDELDAAPSS